MPGLSFICDVARGIEPLVPAARRALDAVCHDRTYRGTVLCRDSACLLTASAYAEYPLACFDLDDVVVHLEGRLYGPTPAAPALRALARALFAPGAADRQAAEWLHDVDGEFVIVAAHRPSGRIAVLNDALGRLPLYAYRRDTTLLVSREPRVIAALLPAPRFDRMGMAQFLLLGFPLGRRTLLEGVDRLPPATCIRIDPRAGTIRETCAPPLDLGSSGDRPPRRRDDAHELASLFAAGCRTRAAADGRNLVSLSGGADARSVAAGLHRLAIPFRCTTFLDAAGVAAADVAVAEQLAARFGAPWHLYRLPPPAASERRSLLRRKAGLNPLSMAYLVPYLAQVAECHGRGSVFFTGDGGDKLLPDLRPAAPIAAAEGAAAALLRARQILPMDQVSALTGVSPADLGGELRERLHAFPEERWADRCAHFEIFERAFKWLFEGEDRNRGFMWSAAPFYAAPFFRAAIRQSGAAKAHRALYGDFLAALSPAAAAVEYAGLGAPIDSDAFRVAAKAAALLAARADRRPRAAPPPDGRTTAATIDRIRAQVARSPAVAQHLRADRLAAFLDGPADRLPDGVDTLFTLTSAIEDLAGDAGGPAASLSGRPQEDGPGAGGAPTYASEA